MWKSTDGESANEKEGIKRWKKKRGSEVQVFLLPGVFHILFFLNVLFYFASASLFSIILLELKISITMQTILKTSDFYSLFTIDH